MPPTPLPYLRAPDAHGAPGTPQPGPRAGRSPPDPGCSLVNPRGMGAMGWRCTRRNGTRWWMRAVDPENRSGGLERFDGVQHAPKSLLGQLQIMAGLHPQPEAFAEAEETAQRSR
jgi:hypothetical protein